MDRVPKVDMRLYWDKLWWKEIPTSCFYEDKPVSPICHNKYKLKWFEFFKLKKQTNTDIWAGIVLFQTSPKHSFNERIIFNCSYVGSFYLFFICITVSAKWAAPPSGKSWNKTICHKYWWDAGCVDRSNLNKIEDNSFLQKMPSICSAAIIFKCCLLSSCKYMYFLSNYHPILQPVPELKQSRSQTMSFSRLTHCNPTISINRRDDYVVQTPATDGLSSISRFPWVRWRWFLIGFNRTESAASCTLVTKNLQRKCVVVLWFCPQNVDFNTGSEFQD